MLHSESVPTLVRSWRWGGILWRERRQSEAHSSISAYIFRRTEIIKCVKDKKSKLLLLLLHWRRVLHPLIFSDSTVEINEILVGEKKSSDSLEVSWTICWSSRSWHVYLSSHWTEIEDGVEYACYSRSVIKKSPKRTIKTKMALFIK